MDILIGTTFKMFMGSPLLEKTDLLEAYVEPGDRRAPPLPGRRRRKMAEIINLRRAPARHKARAEKDKTAEANRVLHGTPKSARKLAEAQRQKPPRTWPATSWKTGR